MSRILQSLSDFRDAIWYERHPTGFVLAPLGWLYRFGSAARKLAYTSGLLGSYEADVPVVVVGNIAVGGTGKTPLVIWLVEYFRSLGYQPGVVARGYRGRAKRWPQQVRPDSDPKAVGDEAILIARKVQCPIAVGPRRGDCVDALLHHGDCDLIVSDDGLQHYALARNFEIAVIDGIRRFGNGRCLPAGPLREPASRIQQVDLVVTNGIAGRGEFAMKYVATEARNLVRQESVRLADFAPKEVHGVAGIGHPERFFSMLRRNGFRVHEHRFRDHAWFHKSDLAFGDELPIFMTEKDAVKCEHLDLSQAWCVPVSVEMPEVFKRRLAGIFGEDEHG